MYFVFGENFLFRGWKNTQLIFFSKTDLGLGAITVIYDRLPGPKGFSVWRGWAEIGFEKLLILENQIALSVHEHQDGRTL